MGILSMRHAAWLAGIGILGKNTLIIDPKFGNMIHIGAILLDVELEGDPMIEDAEKLCPEKCRICLDSCPTKALNGMTVNQLLCRPLSQFKTAKGYALENCNICRKSCPRRFCIRANAKPLRRVGYISGEMTDEINLNSLSAWRKSQASAFQK
jgi:epoxyqueuosine reductase QueG